MKTPNKVQGREVGSLYVDIYQKCGKFNQYGVFVQGDGSFEGDTHCVGIFWLKSLAEKFRDWVEENDPEEVKSIRSQMKLY